MLITKICAAYIEEEIAPDHFNFICNRQVLSKVFYDEHLIIEPLLCLKLSDWSTSHTDDWAFDYSYVGTKPNVAYPLSIQ